MSAALIAWQMDGEHGLYNVAVLQTTLVIGRSMEGGSVGWLAQTFATTFRAHKAALDATEHAAALGYTMRIAPVQTDAEVVVVGLAAAISRLSASEVRENSYAAYAVGKAFIHGVRV